MHLDQAMRDDLALQAQDALRSGRIDRRTFIRLAAVLGIGTAVLGRKGSAFAEDRKVVLGGWGGPSHDAYMNTFGALYNEQRGGMLEIDGTGPTLGKIKAMVESGSTTWDIADADADVGLILGEQGLLEPLDYSILDREATMPGYATEHTIGIYNYGFIIAYDSEAFGGLRPDSAADFWDTQRFPGKRAMYKWMHGMLEAALMADGVARADLYPLDVDRALASVERIRPDVSVFYGSIAEGMEALRGGEVTMAYLPNSRAQILEKTSNGKFGWTWSGGMAFGTGWCIPKGAPNGVEGQYFLKACQDPATQVALLEILGLGPCNPAAFVLMNDEQKRLHPGQPENLAQYGLNDVPWYAENYELVLDRWIDTISG